MKLRIKIEDRELELDDPNIKYHDKLYGSGEGKGAILELIKELIKSLQEVR